MRFCSFSLLAVSVFWLAPAHAASLSPEAPGEATRTRQIQLLHLRMQQGGWTAAGQPTLIEMPAGVDGGQEFPLESGTGFAVGVTCGDECDSIRLSLVDPDGHPVAAGYDTGEGWTLEATIETSGPHRLRLMAEGCAEPCGVGILLFTR